MAGESTPCVFLLHGLLMPAASMLPLERGLCQAGFATRRISYASRVQPWRQSVELLRREVENCASEQIHFVAHSMGGLLVTALLNDCPKIVSGSVVTIGTPFNGSSVARNMREFAPGRWFLGGAEVLLACGLQPRWSDSTALHIIAGTSGVGVARMLFGKGLGSVHDGVVSVDECTPGGMITSMHRFPSNHTLLLVNRAVIERVVFLLMEY